ncbi:MAG: hypothetical protein R3183_12835, partial [Oleiphilaceae bacterium]|nr:hypothetical protein [Oleiphilaceae bacterium]
MTASIPSVTATEKANEGRLVSAEPLRKNLSSSTNNCDTVHKKFRYRSSVSLHHAQYNLPNNAVPAREKLAKKPGQNYLGHKIELSRFSASRFVSKYYVPGEGWGPEETFDFGIYQSPNDVVIDERGHALLVWAYDDDESSTIGFNRYNATSGWASAQALTRSSDGYGEYTPQ